MASTSRVRPVLTLPPMPQGGLIFRSLPSSPGPALYFAAVAVMRAAVSRGRSFLNLRGTREKRGKPRRTHG